MSDAAVSVIIASYNMRSVIGDCLDSVLAQQTSCPFEVIVVDSSSDDTAGLVSEKYPMVTLIRLPRRAYPGEARNAGIKIARGDLVAFTDCDCIVRPGWLERMIRDHRAGWQAIGGPVGNGTPWSPVGTAEFLLEFNSFLGRRPRTVEYMPTCNVAYSRELFDKYGLFPATQKGSDSFFSRTITHAGISILLDPGVGMIHRNRTSLGGFFSNQYNLGIGSAQTRKMMRISGSILLKYPVLSICIPFLRFGAITIRLLRWSLWNAIKFITLFWLIIPGLVVFTAGFLSGIHKPLPVDHTLLYPA